MKVISLKFKNKHNGRRGVRYEQEYVNYRINLVH